MSKLINGGRVNTPKQLVQKWATLPNKLDVNIFNFETIIGAAVEKIFKDSFYLERFNSSGQYNWQPRKSNRFKHPILRETGQLYNSIKWNHLSVSRGSKKGVKIITDPSMFRAINNRHPHFVYAGVHNSGIGNMPKRQFMGHSTYVFEQLRKYTYRIFDGFPK